MANMYDISKKITNKLPAIRLSDELIITVNNRKSNVLAVQAMLKEIENNEKDGKETDEMGAMDNVLKILIGEKSAEAVNKLDLPLPEYKEFYNAVMAASSGQTMEEYEAAQEKRFQQ